MVVVRGLYIVAGCICLVLGSVGAFVPVIPTVPFLLVTVFCFAKGSRRLHDWFVSTDLYKNNLESYVRREGMTARTKIGIMSTMTLVMGIGFAIMFAKGLYLPCSILAAVWVCHLLYFGFGVRTIRPVES
ncbi:MAG: YbaN family protein [Candidatus Methanomethylophilaceae archaeon]|nr:YbaN family protein [Candidatus Methanomethylophilaceae archaeon]